MIDIGFFSEMNISFADNGTVASNTLNEVTYDKNKVINYLLSKGKKIAGCPREAIDCFTKDVIAPSFFIYSDEEYRWADFLVYHVKKYNIKLPQEFVNKVMRS